MLSIIIPTYNEEKNIEKLVSFLKLHAASAEIIVSDGGSEDKTLELAEKSGVITVLSPQKGRAGQMNYAASMAKGDILYFVHADTFPPQNFVPDILNALAKGYDLGRYKTKFLSDKTILRINEWFTRFDFFICMGGDQTLFIKKTFFIKLGGFKEDMQLMEEFEFCARARKEGRYKIMNGCAIISARKYEKNSWLQVQKANYKVVQLYKTGASQELLVETYKRMLKW
ncbi:MAG TPA: TIGR04283 family arsenosugar biosynthesis glycosyltransferase [Chitinophagaceae bacterium]|nr:TIGR04283 family arsenosugar biosynthesis glycosyltransferase [Chitinophagaceae bacterium]